MLGVTVIIVLTHDLLKFNKLHRKYVQLKETIWSVKLRGIRMRRMS